MQFHRNIFTKADVIVTPTVGYCFLLLLVLYTIPYICFEGLRLLYILLVLYCKASWMYEKVKFDIKMLFHLPMLNVHLFYKTA
jgi:hypothetical protein